MRALLRSRKRWNSSWFSSGLAADERLDEQAVRAGDEPAVGGELVRAGQLDEELPSPGEWWSSSATPARPGSSRAVRSSADGPA
jgi:hypothetical protein